MVQNSEDECATKARVGRFCARAVDNLINGDAAASRVSASVARTALRPPSCWQSCPTSLISRRRAWPPSRASHPANTAPAPPCAGQARSAVSATNACAARSPCVRSAPRGPTKPCSACRAPQSRRQAAQGRPGRRRPQAARLRSRCRQDPNAVHVLPECSFACLTPNTVSPGERKRWCSAPRAFHRSVRTCVAAVAEEPCCVLWGNGIEGRTKCLVQCVRGAGSDAAQLGFDFSPLLATPRRDVSEADRGGSIGFKSGE